MSNYKSERKLYRDGKRNPNKVPPHKNITKLKIRIGICLLVLIVSIVGAILEKNGIFTWNDAHEAIGSIDGVATADADFAAYFLDVGQGDCTVIQCDGKTMVVDTSVFSMINEVYSSFATLNIKTIDYLIITHQHDDHMGNAAKILEDYEVKNIIMSKLSADNIPTSQTYEDLLVAIKQEEGIKVIAGEAGYNFNFGSSSVEMFSPTKQDDNLNNMSIVFKITYGDISFLFTGDAEKVIESQLLDSDYDLSANVLKAGHHGSKTSSSNKFIQAVSPEISIISCGRGNSYGHPHNETLDTFDKNNVRYFITALDGDITVTTDGKTLTIITDEVSVKYE